MPRATRAPAGATAAAVMAGLVASPDRRILGDRAGPFPRVRCSIDARDAEGGFRTEAAPEADPATRALCYGAGRPRERRMSDELVFYTHPMSRGRIVRWMLEEIGQPYRTEILDYGTTMKAPAYLAINPMGKVPALRHGDAVVTETAAICAYLADAFPQAGLAPPPGDR